MAEDKKESPFDVVDMPGHPGRYIIVDNATGKVLDNANGLPTVNLKST